MNIQKGEVKGTSACFRFLKMFCLSSKWLLNSGGDGTNILGESRKVYKNLKHVQLPLS